MLTKALFSVLAGALFLCITASLIAVMLMAKNDADDEDRRD